MSSNQSDTYLDIRAFTAKGESRFNYVVLHAMGKTFDSRNALLRLQDFCLQDLNVYLSQGSELSWEIRRPGEDRVFGCYKPESGDLIVQRCRFNQEHHTYPQEVTVL